MRGFTNEFEVKITERVIKKLQNESLKRKKLLFLREKIKKYKSPFSFSLPDENVDQV